MGDNYGLRLTYSGNISMWKRTSSWSSITSKINLLDDGWHNIVGLQNDSGMYLFVDGRLSEWKLNKDGIIYDQGTSLQIGRYGNRDDLTEKYSYDFKGVMDDLRIYDAALTYSQILALAGQSTCNPISEICDGLDNDCNDIIDDGEDILCDNGIFCDGKEFCAGTRGCKVQNIGCSSYDILPIDSCTADPDNNPFTWDYFSGFSSSCNEEADNCAASSEAVFHSCNQSKCGAECDSKNPCPVTKCDVFDGCYEGIYRNYTDVQNVCNSTCSCTENACTSFESVIIDKDSDSYDLYCDKDCNDMDSKIYPGANEVCDGKDNDCDLTIDEGCPCTSGSSRQCGVTDAGECSLGLQNCVNAKWNDCTSMVSPADEICDGKDNDCDNSIDENLERNCGEGSCKGKSVCSLGIWTNCSTHKKDAGVCASCNELGTPIYDSSQVDDCKDSSFCDGEEACSSIYQCSEGEVVNCNNEDITAIKICTSNPIIIHSPWIQSAHLPQFVANPQNPVYWRISTQLRILAANPAMLHVRRILIAMMETLQQKIHAFQAALALMRM
jgi:hypothetical protein